MAFKAKSPADERWLAIKITWLIFALIGLLAVITPFVVPGDMLLVHGPECTKLAKTGTECMVCGMTRSFVAIGNFDISGAIKHNEAGIYVFYLLICQAFVALWMLLVSKNFISRHLKVN